MGQLHCPWAALRSPFFTGGDEGGVSPVLGAKVGAGGADLAGGALEAAVLAHAGAAHAAAPAATEKASAGQTRLQAERALARAPAEPWETLTHAALALAPA